MFEHSNKNYEDSFFCMNEGDVHDNFERSSFENLFNDCSVLLVQNNDCLMLDNQEYGSIKNIFIDPWLNNNDAIDWQLEFAKTGTNYKQTEDRNIHYGLNSNNSVNFGSEYLLSINSEIVKEESKDTFRDNSKWWKKRGPRKWKYSRWGKEEDKLLYASIKNLIVEGEISNNFIENVTSFNIYESESDLEKVKASIDWRNPISNLQKRIQKLFTPKDLSIRDRYRLRRMIKMYKDKPIDYDYLMTEFPGKSKSTLENAVKNLETLKNNNLTL